jgi:hypothetical protein
MDNRHNREIGMSMSVTVLSESGGMAGAPGAYSSTRVAAQIHRLCCRCSRLLRPRWPLVLFQLPSPQAECASSAQDDSKLHPQLNCVTNLTKHRLAKMSTRRKRSLKSCNFHGADLTSTNGMIFTSNSPTSNRGTLVVKFWLGYPTELIYRNRAFSDG